jgi:hypothetical protein
MDYKAGDQVIFLNHTGRGTVTKIEGDLVYITDEDGFEVPFPPSELILKRNTLNFLDRVDADRIDAMVQADLERARRRYSKSAGADIKKDKNEPIEVDLHIHELVEANAHLSNFQMVQIQMAHFNRMMEYAVEHRVPRLVFIHGVGKGVLKQELRDALEFFPNCSFRDGDFRKYGQGATEVSIRFN